MKKIFLIAIITGLASLSFTKSKSDNYKVNIDSSVINWEGFKPTGSHKGTISLSNGNFMVKDGKINGGEFTIDMNSIACSDSAKLVKHLKSDDFFSVEKFPIGSFQIKGSKNMDGKTLIEGELTMKGITNPVTFLADVMIEGNKLSLKSETFKVDRSKWDIRYKSKSFFDDLKNKYIDDDMEISVAVEAIK